MAILNIPLKSICMYVKTNIIFRIVLYLKPELNVTKVIQKYLKIFNNIYYENSYYIKLIWK